MSEWGSGGGEGGMYRSIVAFKGRCSRPFPTFKPSNPITLCEEVSSKRLHRPPAVVPSQAWGQLLHPHNLPGGGQTWVEISSGSSVIASEICMSGDDAGRSIRRDMCCGRAAARWGISTITGGAMNVGFKHSCSGRIRYQTRNIVHSYSSNTLLLLYECHTSICDVLMCAVEELGKHLVIGSVLSWRPESVMRGSASELMQRVCPFRNRCSLLAALPPPAEPNSRVLHI